MGLEVNGIKCLLSARKIGVSFKRVMMIGRQGLFITPDLLRKNLAKLGIEKSFEEIAGILSENGGFAEPFFLKILGAEDVQSIDYSTFENASVIHDMNIPVPDDLKNRFTAVIESGSLEHIFNVSQALKNCMEMTKVGGHFIGIMPANNYMGHGFFQFSPELLWRVFGGENGFIIEQMILFESVPNPKFYKIKDPKEIGERVTLVNQKPAYIFIQAKRITSVEIFLSYPQQSDWVALWNKHSSRGDRMKASEGEFKIEDLSAQQSRLITAFKSLLPRSLRIKLGRCLTDRKYFSLMNQDMYRSRGFNPKYYEEVDITNLK